MRQIDDCEQLEEDLNAIRLQMSKDNVDTFMPMLNDKLKEYAAIKLMENPSGYNVLPQAATLPGPPWLSIAWGITAPGPYQELDGTTGRPLVNVTYLTVFPSSETELTRMLIESPLLFSEAKQAQDLAAAMSLGRKVVTAPAIPQVQT